MDKALKGLFLLLLFVVPVRAQVMQQAIVNSTPEVVGSFTIAHDADSNWNTSATCPLNANTGNTCTWAHTVTGTHPFLWVVIGCRYDFTSCSLAASHPVTFNGVDMTKAIGPISDATNFFRIWAYYITGQTGTANIVVTNTGNIGVASGWFAAASSFTGVNQSSPFDVAPQSGGPTTATSINLAANLVADNDWIVGGVIGRNTNGGSYTKTQGTLVYANSNNTPEFATGYQGPISPAALTNDGYSYSASTTFTMVNAAIKAG